MSRQTIFGEDARAKLAEGVDILFRAVSCTLGPKGRNVLMKPHDHPAAPLVLTKDGVSTAKEVRDLPDVFVNMGCTLLREAASKTSDLAGDGTTTSVVLANAIFTEGLKQLAEGANPVGVKRGIDKAVAIVVERLKEIAIPVTTDEQIAQIATISSNGDRNIGELVLKAMQKVGRDGVITLGESADSETHLEVVEGMQFDRGLLAQPMITDPQRMQCVLENPFILLTERKIANRTEGLDSIFEYCHQQQRPLLIIAGDFEQAFIVFMIVNLQNNVVRSAAVKAPAFGEQRTALIEDMSVVTGAYAFTENCGRKLDSIQIEDLGEADRVTCTRDTTTIAGGKGSESRIASRIELLRTLVSTEKEPLKQAQFQDRLAKLASGVAILQVGGATDIERRELRDRVEDAVMATKAAVQEGILPGGGKALIECRFALQPEFSQSVGDEKIGMQIVYESLGHPTRQICLNAGLSEDEIEKVFNVLFEERHKGYNAATGQFEDLVAAGVIDPMKVTRVALQNAASVAAAMLTCEAMVAAVPEGKS